MKIVSYGGGVQSTALLVLAVTGRLDTVMGRPDVAIFANVGDDSEHPDTLDYVHNVAKPWATEHGLDIREVFKVWFRGKRGTGRGDATNRKGKVNTLYSTLMDDKSKSIEVPVWFPKSGFGNRSCTTYWKVRVVKRWLETHGATEENPATVAIGISADEFHRANASRAPKVERVVYPLLDLQMTRDDCKQVILDAGLPVPPKSSCWFCPFRGSGYWEELSVNNPDLFFRAVNLEQVLDARRKALGKDGAFLSNARKPLTEAVGFGGADADPGECDDGYCFV